MADATHPAVDGDPEQTVDAVAPTTLPGHVAVERSDYPNLRVIERDHYVIVGEIAKGGMGRVLEARDRRLGRRVAIKELLPKHRDAARRFEREARITARLQHPAIVHVYEAGTWPGGEPFYAMTRIDGRSLGCVVAERPALNDRLALLPHVIAAADALAYAHKEHVIHRDLKPSNVLVGDYGETVVVDWGLAKDLEAGGDAGDSLRHGTFATEAETRSGSIVGTPAYMPPEQARGEPVDRRADVYALGALLYTLLVGSPPYSGATSDDVVTQVVAGPPPPVDEREPGAPRDLVAIVRKAMARDPSERYTDAGELAADLKRFQTGQLVAAHRYTARQLFVRWVRRRRFALLAAAGVVAVIGIVASVSVSRILAEKARAEARRFALLEERGRSELLAGHAGRALAYLAGAARDGIRGGVRGILIAQAMRPFEAELARFAGGPLLAVSANGRIATAGTGPIVVRRTDGTIEASAGDHRGVRALVWDAAGAQLAAAGDAGVAWVWSNGHTTELAVGTPIVDAAFDPSGRRLALAETDGNIDVWDLARGVQIAQTRCHDGRVATVRFSHGGDRIVSAGDDGTACVWVVAMPALRVLLRGHARPVTSASWVDDDDRWIVTASEDGTARVWDAATGKLVVSPLRHDGNPPITQVIVSRDARLIVTTASDGSAREWELPSHPPEPGSVAPARPRVTFAGHEGAILAAVFSADGTMIATGDSDRHAKLWDAAHGQLLASFEHGDIVTTVAFVDGDRKLVTAVGTRGAVVWDTRRGKQRIDLESAVHAIAVAPDGTVAAGTDDSLVTLVHGESRTVLRGHLGRVRALAFTPDGRTLVTAGDDAKPLLWDVHTARIRGALGEHAAPVTALAIADDGATIATLAAGAVEVWTAAGTHLDRYEPANQVVTAIAFGRDGAIYAGLDDGELVRWTRSGTQAWPALRGAVTALAFSHDDLMIAGRNEAVMFAQRAAWVPRVAFDRPGEIRAAAFTADGTCVITAGDAGFEVWDAAAGKLVATHVANAGGIEAIAVASETLWTASTDHSITSWDVRSEPAAQDVVAAFARTHDPWWLDDNDVLRIREERDGQR